MPTRSYRSARAALLVVVGLVGTPPAVLASAFAIFEQGAEGMGFAGAYTALASDPSAIFHNAAGIAFLKGTQIYLGGAVIAPSASFTGDEPFPGSHVTETDDSGLIIPPVADYTHQISDRLAVGVGLHVPYHLRTRWANRETTFTGRFISKSAEIRSISINPTVAYKLADRLAVGAGIDVRLNTVALRRNVGLTDPFTLQVVDVAALDLESDRNIGIGFNVGLLAKPTEGLSFGVAYRHKVKVDFTGRANFVPLATGNPQLDALVATTLPSGTVPLTTSIEFPSILSLGLAYAWNEWTLVGDVTFHRWSSFDELPLTFEGRDDLSSVVEWAYEDSRIYRFGIERQLGARWAVRGGYYYDQNPSPPESVSPLLPDADRHGLAAGLGFESGSWKLDVASWYQIFEDRSTEGVSRDNYNGTYDSGAMLLAVSIGYRF